jgi:hypothetical protein
MKALRVLLLVAVGLLGSRACFAVPAAHPGDILLTTYTGHVVLFHPEKGTWEDFASLSPFHQPSSIVREPSGNFLISDLSGAILRLDATSGNVTIVSQVSPPLYLLYRPWNILFGPDGLLYVAEDSDVIRVDPVSGAQQSVSSHQWLTSGCGLRFGTDGKIYVSGRNFAGEGIVRVDPLTGSQQDVSQDGLLASPFQLDVQQDGSLLVANWDFGSSELLRIDPITGAQSTIVAGIDTTAIPGMARDASGGEYLTGVPGGNIFTGAPTGLLLYFNGTSVSTVASFPFGVHGIYIFPGSSPVSTQTLTWGAVKGKYR